MRRAPAWQPPDERLPPDRAEIILERQIQRAQEILAQQEITEPEYSAWQNNTREYLQQAFGRDSGNVQTVMEAGRFPYVGGAIDPFYRDALQRQVAMLRGCLEQLREKQVDWRSPTTVTPAVTLPTPMRPAPARGPSKDVFVVHGREDAPKAETALLLTRLGLTPIILHEHPNLGRTIIEKFEAFANVGFAVILLTPDDRGGLRDEPFEAERLRARQNVWLELGFFLGKLGRSHVCALYRRGVEIPSDYQGVILVELDEAGAWQYRLAQELRAAGYRIDIDRVTPSQARKPTP